MADIYGDAIDSDVFSFTSSDMTLIMYSDDPTKISFSPYTIYIYGY
jgi:hypothetical protein